MIFINPMWDHESQRIGKKMCTPLGYALHVISDLVGFVGLLLLPAAIVYLAFKGITGSFHARLLWLIAVPFVVGFVGTIIHSFSWLLADRRGFQYDAQTCEASWMENGQRRTFKWKAEPGG